MYQSGGYRKPLSAAQYAGRNTGRFQDNLYRCSTCGRITFLGSMPCGNCGGTVQRTDPADNPAADKYRAACVMTFLLPAVILTVLAVLWIGIAAGVLFLLLTAAGTAGILPLLSGKGPEGETVGRVWWMFHGSWKGLAAELFCDRTAKQEHQPLLKAEWMEPVLDAWYLDADRMERLCAIGRCEEALQGCRSLEAVYRNPRLSRLQMRAILKLKNNENELFALEEICVSLVPEELSREERRGVLRLLEDAVLQNAVQETTSVSHVFRVLALEEARDLSEQQKRLCKAGSSALKMVLQRGEAAYCGLLKADGTPENPAEFLDRLVGLVISERAQWDEGGRLHRLLFALNLMPGMEYRRAQRRLLQLFYSDAREREACRERLERLQRGPRLQDFLTQQGNRRMTAALETMLIDEDGRLYRENAVFGLKGQAPLLNGQTGLEEEWTRYTKERRGAS